VQVRREGGGHKNCGQDQWERHDLVFGGEDFSTIIPP
jgi:hypothetical protein